MRLAAVLIRISRRRDLFPRGAAALLERVGIGRHDFLRLAVGDCREAEDSGLRGVILERVALLRSASFRSIGIPCFFKTSAKASSANSWIVAMRLRPSCLSLSKVSS